MQSVLNALTCSNLQNFSYSSCWVLCVFINSIIPFSPPNTANPEIPWRCNIIGSLEIPVFRKLHGHCSKALLASPISPFMLLPPVLKNEILSHFSIFTIDWGFTLMLSFKFYKTAESESNIIWILTLQLNQYHAKIPFTVSIPGELKISPSCPWVSLFVNDLTGLRFFYQCWTFSGIHNVFQLHSSCCSQLPE